MRVETQVAYILHKRPFRDTSQILDVFTREHGRISLMSRGSRGAKSRTGGLLQIFRPLLISWQGRGDMPFLSRVEMADIKAPVLSGKSQMSAMYINELLVYLLHKNDVHAEIFDRYHACLYALNEAENIETILRLFEKELLQLLGFGLNLNIDADSGEAVREECHYAYHFEHGPVICEKNRQLKNPVLSGLSLIAFDHNEIVSEQHRSEIKKLMRYVLAGHLGHKKLKSRELFRKPVIRNA
ncbi:MAG: DNA repair protein RecO [Gammaproteobacteria bacterium]|nr:DNA repair protein RecO [Gammaproteobacteria bacterium]